MAKKSKFMLGLVLFFALIFFVWTKRTVEIKIASVVFKIPAHAIINVDTIQSTIGLDKNQGIAIDLPNGPYFGHWGLLLQSSKERRGNGIPLSLYEALKRNEIALKKSSFGWLECGNFCEQENWYFERPPQLNDSVYSVGTLICHETDICKINFSYRDVDVQVSIERKDINDASNILKNAMTLLTQMDVTEKIANK